MTMRTPLNMARLRTTRRTAFCWVLSTWAGRTSSAVRPNLVGAPVAVTAATAAPHRGVGPDPGPAPGMRRLTPPVPQNPQGPVEAQENRADRTRPELAENRL